ncbi:hypothetical protein [Rhodococcus sp. IEGM 1318]|nr:hypothetical protein [Rhodococcus sp. IEGM 1318]MDV8009313.1 hypothetical protein [Rhodococcus sp. IEGM 1318]
MDGAVRTNPATVGRLVYPGANIDTGTHSSLITHTEPTRLHGTRTVMT